MPITRNGPVMNMDTEQPLRMVPAHQRFTRSQAHRLLKLKNIPHDPGAPMAHLLYVMQMNNVQPAMTEPGVIDPPEEPKGPRSWMEETADDGYPKQIGKLKSLCKKRGIKYHPKAKRPDLVKMLNSHV